MVRFPLYLAKVLFPIIACGKAMLLDRKYHYDALWAMMSYMGFPAVLFRMIRRKVPYILTLQEGDDLEMVSGRRRIRIVRGLFKRVFDEAAVVQAISTYLRNWAYAQGFAGVAEVVPNAVDTERFARVPVREELSPLESKTSKKQSDRIIITTSRLVEKNGIGDAIQSLQYLPEDIQFFILGTGPLRESLEKQAHNAGVAHRVRFVGHVPYEDIPLYLHIADVFVRPSHSEGMGNSFIEAMAAGIPVVATPVGGIPDFLVHKRTGLFARVGDPKSIAEQIERFFNDQALKRTVVENAQDLVRTHYDWNKVAHDMRERVFARVLAEQI